MSLAILWFLDSTTKCNSRMIEEYLIRCSKIKTFSRTIIKSMHYHFDFLISDSAEFTFLWEVLSD